MREPATRAAILDNPPDLSGLMGPARMMAEGWNTIYPMGDQPDYEPGPDQSLAAMAEREGRSPAEIAYDLLLERDGKGILYLPVLGYARGDLEDMREMMLHPQSVFGLSDGGAHCGLICDASIPTYLLTHWARDRERGEKIPIETLVHCQTQKTATFYGMDDRGVLAPGMKADVNVIDFDNLTIRAPEMIYDLPAGGRRLVQEIEGYRYTIVSGEVTRRNGEDTGARPGRLIRGAR